MFILPLVTADGKLLTFGCSRDGRLGHGNASVDTEQWAPRRVEFHGGRRVRDVACGKDFTLALIQSVSADLDVGISKLDGIGYAEKDHIMTNLYCFGRFGPWLGIGRASRVLHYPLLHLWW